VNAVERRPPLQGLLVLPPEREALEALIAETQRDIIGLVRLKRYKDNIIVVARKSLKSLYDLKSPPWRAAEQLTTKATLLDLLG
jgi:argininosuccinate synthase